MKISAKIKANATKEVSKDFADDWGVFWFIAGEVVGKWMLGVLGWAADTMILFSILYAGTKRFWVSLAIAAIICLVMQLVSGSATFKITKSIRTGTAREGAYLRSIAVAGFISISILGASLWFSFNTKDVYEVAAQDALQGTIKSEVDVLAYYETKIAQKAQQKAQALSVVQEQIAQWQGVTWKGVVTTKAQREIEGLQNQMNLLQNRFDAAIMALEKERMNELTNVREANASAVTSFQAKVIKGGDTFRWVNIAINLLRVLLIIGLSVATVDIGKEALQRKAQRAATPAPTPELIPVSNTSVGRATPVSNAVSAQELDEVLKEIQRQRRKLAAYQTRLRKREGVASTQEAGVKRCEEEIERLEGEKTRMLHGL